MGVKRFQLELIHTKRRLACCGVLIWKNKIHDGIVKIIGTHPVETDQFSMNCPRTNLCKNVAPPESVDTHTHASTCTHIYTHTHARAHTVLIMSGQD